MANRITQVALEVVVAPTVQRARVTQAALEVVVAPSVQRARITQAVLEVVVLPTVQRLRITQAVLEVVVGKISGESFGWSRGALAFPIIGDRVTARSRILNFAGGVADFVLDQSEWADFVIVFGFKGVNIGAGRVSWSMVNPTVPPGSFEIVSDDEEVLLIFQRDALNAPPAIHFVGSAARIQVDMVLLSWAQLNDLRAWLKLPPINVPR